MPHEVRLSDPEALEDLFKALYEAKADVRRRGARNIAVYGSDDDLETELRFFVRAWALSRPAVTIELDRVPLSR